MGSVVSPVCHWGRWPVGTLTAGFFPGDIAQHSLWFILQCNFQSNTSWKPLASNCMKATPSRCSNLFMTAGPHGHRCIPTLLHCEDSSKDTVLGNIHGNDSTPNLSQWNQCNTPAFAKHLLCPNLWNPIVLRLLPICTLPPTTGYEDISIGYQGQEEDLSIKY